MMFSVLTKRPPNRWLQVICAVLVIFGFAAPLRAQDPTIETEYLATIYAPLDPPQIVGSDLFIYNVPADREGYIKGPKINAKLIQPCADWFQMHPNNPGWLDVRCTARADDGSLIYVEESGVSVWSEEADKKCNAGEVITGSDANIRTHLKFRTTSEKYAWLNNIIVVGKMTALKCGEGGYIQYDAFAVN